MSLRDKVFLKQPTAIGRIVTNNSLTGHQSSSLENNFDFQDNSDSNYSTSTNSNTLNQHDKVCSSSVSSSATYAVNLNNSLDNNKNNSQMLLASRLISSQANKSIGTSFVTCATENFRKSPSKNNHLVNGILNTSCSTPNKQQHVITTTNTLKRNISSASITEKNGIPKICATGFATKTAATDGMAAVRGGDLTFLKGDPNRLPPHVLAYIREKADMCKPDNIFVCEGSHEEANALLALMQNQGTIKKLHKYQNCWLTLTDPADVARVESKTFISTPEKRETIPTPKEGIKGTLGNWMSPTDMSKALWQDRFPGCMKGRTMYVIPFSMGPLGSPLSKIGIEITDSPYVVLSMAVMTKVSPKVLEELGKGESFVKCLHSIGQPMPMKKQPINNWPCNPEKTLIAHIPNSNEIASFGSGYGGNSLLGKKCFALRLGSILGKREGWLAEHMLIMGFTPPHDTVKSSPTGQKDEKFYLTAAFPSACGKTNMAMMNPTLPGSAVTTVGDDICWMKFNDSGDGTLRAINPETGFFGVAPGTSYKTNPNAMEAIRSNTIFTNVAETSDGGVFWEGLEEETFGVNNDRRVEITSWTGMKNWTKESGKFAAHPNSRFCAPAGQCPVIDTRWQDPQGVPISAIVFGGRRPQGGVPLVYAAFDWKHGVFMGSSMRSETTAAAEHKGKVIMHDPFAMRPFFGYNFGQYLQHWLDVGAKDGRKLPHIFHVNWFRKHPVTGEYLWPGFGENSRVIDWIYRFCKGEDVAVKTAIGYIPKPGSLNLKGLEHLNVDYDALFSIPKTFWQQECLDIAKYYQEQLPEDLPNEIANQLFTLHQRVNAMPDDIIHK